jgi:hypothetical protein
MHALVKFIVFVIVGPVLVGLLYFAVMKPAVTSATRDMTSNMQRQSAAAAERAKAQRADAAQQAAETQRAQMEAAASQLRAETAAALAEQQEAARKAAAWSAFFKPRKDCDNPKDWDTQVECGNAHIRAKREFEDRWAKGEL